MKILSLSLLLLVSCRESALEGPGIESRAARQESTLASPSAPSASPRDSLVSRDSLPPRDSLRRAVRRALPFLEEQGTAWMAGKVPIQGGSPCVSCHHVGYSLWSQNEARRAGVPGTRGALEALTADALEFLSRPGVPRAFATSSVLLAEARPSEALVRATLDLQTSRGAWQARGQFPTQRRPIRESDEVATLWSLLALAEDAEAAALPAASRARKWLDQGGEGLSTEWLAARLTLARAQGDEERERESRRELLSRQNADGGWGWLSDDESEAFSTGQALFALASTAATGSPVESAVRYLLETQQEDGTWLTSASAVSREPDDSKEVIYRFWGTSWATIGLSRLLRSADPELAGTLARAAPDLPRTGSEAASEPVG